MKKLVFIIIYYFFNCSCASATEFTHELHVYTEKLPPFQTFENNEIAGIATQKVKEILNIEKLKTSFHVVPWARAFNTVKHNKNTLIYSMHLSPEREPFFHWLAVVANIQNGFIALTDRQLKINNINETKSFITAVLRSGYAYDFLKSKGFSEHKNLFIVDSRADQINLLLNKKIDFLFLDLSAMQQELLSIGKSPSLIEHVLTKPEWARDLYLAMNKNSEPALVSRIEKSVSAID